jgi:hypothetical protein
MRKFNFDALRSLDVFFSYDHSPLGGIVRFGETGQLKSCRDGMTPNHEGMFWSIDGQMFISEVGPRGVRPDSTDKYESERNHVIAVFRFKPFADQATASCAQAYMALWVRRWWNSRYDLWGAIRSSAWVRKLLPWLKQDPARPFCSENVTEFFRQFGAIWPLDWQRNPPHPLLAIRWCYDHPEQWEERTGYYK